MADHEITIKLRDAENKLATLMSDLQARDTELAGLKLTLKDREATINAQNAELATLRDNDKKRAEADEAVAVDTAFATYKDTKKLTDLDKEQMLLTYRGNRDLFNKLYPVVAPDQRHLQRTLSNRVNPAAQGGTHGTTVPMGGYQVHGQQVRNGSGNFAQDHFELTQRLMSEEKMPLEKATVEARKRLMAPPSVTT
jgi:hypothetical protein